MSLGLSINRRDTHPTLFVATALNHSSLFVLEIIAPACSNLKVPLSFFILGFPLEEEKKERKKRKNQRIQQRKREKERKSGKSKKNPRVDFHQDFRGLLLLLVGMDEQRALMDQLMGANRDLPPEEAAKRKRNFWDSDIDKYFLCGLCPALVFKNTKSETFCKVRLLC